MTEPGLRWTEHEWLSHVDSFWMLRKIEVLLGQTGVNVSERKWLLFAIACLRRVQHAFTDERSRRVVTALDQYADRGIMREDVLQIAKQSVDPPNADNLSEMPLEDAPLTKNRLP